ncbi:MAG: DUF1887 family protein [Betaproteobacteria bacterium]|nr:DUF1887 family protein [Betaproteobacteria bacterium]
MLIHVVLVSEQTIPNLVPALMDKPAKVYLVATETMKRKGLPQRLKGVLQKRGIAAEILSGAPDTGLESIIGFASMKVADRLQKNHPSAKVVLNATGGTKPMVLGFTEVFRTRAARVIYTDTAHRRIESLAAAGGGAAGYTAMESVLDVEIYLAAQGFTIERARSDDRAWLDLAKGRRAACEFLAQRIEERGVQNLIGALNGLAHKALDGQRKLVAPKQTLESDPGRPWPEVLDQLQGFGLIRRNGRNIEFRDQGSACFLHGDWLEEYVWQVLRDEGMHDVRLGVIGRWDQAAKAENEFDVLATHMNELLFVECKTLKHGGKKAKDADLLYKVDSLGQDVRGLFGTTWLITARSPEPEMIDRARQQGVKLLGPSELHGLSGHVHHWKAGRVDSG